MIKMKCLQDKLKRSNYELAAAHSSAHSIAVKQTTIGTIKRVFDGFGIHLTHAYNLFEILYNIVSVH